MKRIIATARSSKIIFIVIACVGALSILALQLKNSEPEFDRRADPFRGSANFVPPPPIKPIGGLIDLQPVQWYEGFLSTDGRFAEVWLQVGKSSDHCSRLGKLKVANSSERVLISVALGHIPVSPEESRCSLRAPLARTIIELSRPAPNAELLDGLRHGLRFRNEELNLSR